MEDTLRTILEQAVAENMFPGAVIGYVTRDGEHSVIPVGRETYEHTAPRLSSDSVFDVASVTKAIPVSSLALYLIDNGKLELDQRVKDILPELSTNYQNEMTIWHLLTQTLDFRIPLSSLKGHTPVDMLAAIFSTQFPNPPGSVMNYSNATSIILGLVIERVAGKKLDVLADDVFFGPLGMTRTSFHPHNLAAEQIVPTEDDPWRGRIIRGEVHDESAAVLKEVIIPGSAGLFSNVPDLLAFLSMLLHGGVARERRFFSEEMIHQMTTNQLATISQSGGLGWELNQPRFMGSFVSSKTIGKTGFTGCVVIADLEKGIGMTLLSNYHYPRRRESAEALHSVRRAVADAIFSQALA